jgi:hypothetical protein
MGVHLFVRRLFTEALQLYLCGPFRHFDYYSPWRFR